MVRSLFFFVALAGGVLALPWLVGTPTGAQEQPAGAAATQRANSQRDRHLQQLASEHAHRGDWIAAMQTLSTVNDGATLAQALDQVQSILGQGSHGDSGGEATDRRSRGAEQSLGGESSGGQSSGRQGGASFADFTALMDLIQSTIVPDSWEQAGGTSTVRPYPGGILVDPSGLVTDITLAQPADDLTANLAVLLAQEQRVDSDGDDPAVDPWRLPAAHRCVSLRGVAREVLRHRLSGTAISETLRHLAGLSRVSYVVLVPERRDVILIGPVGGIESHQGWLRDRRSGLPAIRLDFLTATLSAVLTDQPLGCSIDPAPNALAAAANVSAAIRSGEIPLGMAADALRQALGEQSIRVFGIAGDTPLAHLTVQADRHMKHLSLGLEPMPRGTSNYLDVLTKHIQRGPPDGQLLRLWFTASPMAVRVSSDAQAYQLGGRPMKLSSETQLAGPQGERLASPDDVRLLEFVEGFNKNLNGIIRAYPAYGALQSVYHAAAIAELLRRSTAHDWLSELLAPMLLDDASAGVMRVPRRVASIATGHQLRHGGKRHFILLASGGVRVEPAATVAADFEIYPSIDAVAAHAQPLAGQSDRWWWDAR